MKNRIWHNRKGPGRTHHHVARVNSGGTKWLAPQYRPKKSNPRVEKSNPRVEKSNPRVEKSNPRVEKSNPRVEK